MRTHMVLLVAALMLTVAACSVTAPTRFYVLDSSPGPGSRHRSNSCIILGVGPVEIPAYLDRPQIVVRLSPNEIQPLEFDQWGEPLAQGIARVVAEEIARHVCVQRVEYFPWKSFAGVDHQVSLRVKRLEASPGQKVEFLAHWVIYGADPKKPLAEGELDMIEPTTSRLYEELVAAKSRLLQKAARLIAEAMMKLGK
ncbi:MAG: PqiC family protein [bacterium]